MGIRVSSVSYMLVIDDLLLITLFHRIKILQLSFFGIMFFLSCSCLISSKYSLHELFIQRIFDDNASGSRLVVNVIDRTNDGSISFLYVPLQFAD